MSAKCVIKSLGYVKTVRPTMFCSEGGAICREELAANFNQVAFSRRTTPAIEKYIEEIWQGKREYHPRIYNGNKFRINGWQVSESQCVLNVGLTSYKELCGTNLSPNFRELQEIGFRQYGSPQACMSDTIGVGILLLTSDGCLVVTRRAPWTGEYPGMLDRPGGHPEPERVFLPSGELRPELQENFDVNKAVMDEIWTSAAQEAEDEIGLPKKALVDMKFLGLSQNVVCGDRPSMEFFARLSMKSEEVQAIYDVGLQREADESTALQLIPSGVTNQLPRVLIQYHLQEVYENKGVVTDTEKKKEQEKQEFSAKFHEEEKFGVKDDDKTYNHCTNSNDFNEAKALLEEVTPALKAGLLLAYDHNLL